MNHVDRCLELLDRVCPPLGRWAHRCVQRERQARAKRYWTKRINLTIACPDNAHIPRLPKAGQIADGLQVMHNGLLVYYGSYSHYGDEMHEILRQNRGVHEPQEERVFAAVLPHVASGGVIAELGACWAFYSLWFATEIPDARVFLIEANPACLAHGQRNFELNNLTAHQTRAWVGGPGGRGPDGAAALCVDDFMAAQKLERLAILHSDIQGAELAMLQGAQQALRAGKIDYLFVSTHSDELHHACAKYLSERGYVLIASANVSQSFSTDGVLVAKRATLPHPGPVPIALR